MAEIGVVININTFDASNEVQNILKRLKDASKAFKTIANFMRKKVIVHFRDQEGETAKWKALSPVTEALRRKGPKKGLGNQILRNTGNLFNSIQNGGSDGIFEFDATHAKVGTTIHYAKYHQQPDNKAGTNSYSGKNIIPKRDFMYLKADDITELKEILTLYLTKNK